MTVSARQQLPFAPAMEQAIVRFARQGKTDDWIACEMNRRGYRSALRPFVPLSLIRTIRRQHEIAVPPPTLAPSHPRLVHPAPNRATPKGAGIVDRSAPAERNHSGGP